MDDTPKRAWWQRVGNHCQAYDGPQLAALVAACSAPDGSYWALQAWQPNLPHRGFPPYKAGQTDWELDVSHWTTPLAQLEVHADWAFDGQAHNLFGRLIYNGVPVHGFHTVKGTGAPQDRYGRSLYIDTFDSAYGSGWKRETSIVFRNPTGVVLLLVLADARRVAAGEAGAARRERLQVPDRGGRPGRDAEPGVDVADPGSWDTERCDEDGVRARDEVAAAAALPGRQVLPRADVGSQAEPAPTRDRRASRCAAARVPRGRCRASRRSPSRRARPPCSRAGR